MKKVFKVVSIILIVTIFLGSIFYYVSKYDVLGWRVNFQIQKVETKEYKGLAPNIKFKYSTVFDIDADDTKKYGDTYVIGIKLKTDNRTGCDVRIKGPKLDYSKSADDLAVEVTKEISQSAKYFKILKSEKISIDGRDAFNISFSFLDPIDARIQLEQVFVSDDKLNYFIMCGTGEQQYNFFSRDFDTFFNSIDFDITEEDMVD